MSFGFGFDNTTLMALGSTPFVLIGGNSTNLTNVKGAPGKIFAYEIGNSDTNPVCVKFYDAPATGAIPVVGTTVPIRTIYLPATTSLASQCGGIMGLSFYQGIWIATTKLMTVSDTTAVTANTCAVNLSYK
jgi:hypothetical protein